MKKIAVVLVHALAVALLCSGTALAMTLNGPGGSQTNGWYKDGFYLQILHGTTACSGGGTAFQYIYNPGSSEEGTHHYTILADNVDNPYVIIDHSGSPIPLDMKCPPTGSGGTANMLPEKDFDASIDSQPPYITFTNPSSTANTTAASYVVSGIAGDTGSGVRSIHIVTNGISGPEMTISVNTFSVPVTLKNGANTVQAVATDKVGHTANSNTVTIYSGTSAGGSSSAGGTSGSGSGTSSQNTTSSSSDPTSPVAAVQNNSGPKTAAPSSSSGATSNQTVKFNQEQVLTIQDSADTSSDPADIQATAALAGATGATYGTLWVVIGILFALCAVVVWRFRPIFAELDRDKSGLRRRIIIIVTLPSLIPLLGLGFLGYQQLSSSVKNSLSSQLEKAAQTSAIKLNREFNIRRTIISKSGSDILQITSQYQTQRDTLMKQQNNCSAIVTADIPGRQYAKVTSSDDCLPFLTGFAQLASVSVTNVNAYQSALNQGAAQAQQNLTAQEQQRIDELLGSIKHYFPDILELDITDPSSNATIKAALPRTDGNPSITAAHPELLKQASSDYLALFDTTAKSRQLILTYPIKSGSQSLGGATAAFDTDNKDFIPSIWTSTPKPYASDQVYFVTTAGELITPIGGSPELSRQIKSIADTASGSVYDLKLASQTLATRTSPVANSNWVVAVSAPANSILAPLAGIQRTALLAIAGFLLLSVLLGIYFVSGIAGEIERLFRGALSFAKGDLDYRIALSSHDELQVLGETMNRMATDIKTAQQALIDKDKEFINVATHELKAPMTSIIGNLSMITEDGMGRVDETARKLILQAYYGTTRLRDIVTDMLDIARLESGHAEFKPESLDIRSITQGIIDMHLIPAKQANVSLAYQPAQDLPAVTADKNKLTIIITNFVSNAIKYNRAGGTVTVAHTVEGNKLVTAITDTGLGIPEDQQTHMFEKFFRVQHEDRASVPGTGLGLHITKRFIEAMGGTVWFKSIHGQGTTFYFGLPLSSAATSDQSASGASPTPAVSPAHQTVTTG